AEVTLLGSENVVFTEALGRVLREDVVAPADVPQADNTAMDGYAVRADDIASPPVRLKGIEDLPAGAVATRKVDAGTAIRIMTGALIPDGADTVAHVEITDAGSDFVTVKQSLKRGTNLRRRGEDMRAGNVVLHDGTPIGAAEVGVRIRLHYLVGWRVGGRLRLRQRRSRRPGRRNEVLADCHETGKTGRALASSRSPLLRPARQSRVVHGRVSVVHRSGAV